MAHGGIGNSDIFRRTFALFPSSVGWTLDQLLHRCKVSKVLETGADTSQFHAREILRSRKFSFFFFTAVLVYAAAYKMIVPSGNSWPLVASGVIGFVHACAFASCFCQCKGWELLPSTTHAISLIFTSLVVALVHPEVQVRLSTIYPVLYGEAAFRPPRCANHIYYLHNDEPCHISNAHYSTMLLEATCLFFVIFILKRWVALTASILSVAVYTSVVQLLGKNNNCSRSCDVNGPEETYHFETEFIIFAFNVAIAVMAKWKIECYNLTLFLDLQAKQTEMVHEKVLRCQAEFDRERILSQAHEDRDGVSESKAASSGQVVTNFCIDNVDQQLALKMFASLAQREHWHISIDDVMLHPSHILGVGGFGAVVAGEHHGMSVAVKIAKGEFSQDHGGLAELANELRILRRIRHHNVVNFYGACIDPDNGALALVMERVDGIQLDRFVNGSRGIPKARDRHVLVLDVSSALLYLHKLTPPVAHCDLKPSNIMVETCVRGPRARLLDFGLAHLSIGQSLSAAGTLSWIAPEVVQCEGPVDRISADVFSFGRIVHFVITGRLPFKGLGRHVIRSRARQILVLHWPSIVDFPRECIDLINLCVSFESSSRPRMEVVMSRLVVALRHNAELYRVKLSGAMLDLKHGCSPAGQVYADVDPFNGHVSNVSQGWAEMFGANHRNAFFLFPQFKTAAQNVLNQQVNDSEDIGGPFSADFGTAQVEDARGRLFSCRGIVTVEASAGYETFSNEPTVETCLLKLSLHRIVYQPRQPNHDQALAAVREEDTEDVDGWAKVHL